MIATLIVISHRKIFNKKPKTVCYFQVLDDKMVIQPDDVENVLGQKGTWNSNNDNINVKILQGNFEIKMHFLFLMPNIATN